MTWTNGEVLVGSIGHGFWSFEEHLVFTGPDTVFPCRDGVTFSPNAISLRYVWSGEWRLGTGSLNGLIVLGDELGPHVTARYDKAFMYSCRTPDAVCEHSAVETPGWLKRLAADRMELLPKPPGVVR